MKFNDVKAFWSRKMEERRDRKEMRRRERQAMASNDPHHSSRFWLLDIPAAATICAAFVEVYWALLFCIQATGAVDWNWSTALASTTPPSGAWDFSFSAHLPVLIGLLAATAPIVMLSMVWLPVQFAMRGAGRFRRGTLIGVGLLANILVIVSGTIVMNSNRQEQVRESVVVEQTAAQGRAAIDARLAFEQDQLRLALSNSNPYLNQAANVGAAEWERSYVAQARASNDPRLPMLERALGAARAADQRRANIERLTVERAQAAPEAATAANVEDRVGVGLNTFAQYAEVYRPPFIAMICTLIGIFGAWWTLAMLERLNPRDVLRSGWASDAERIEDLREEEPVVAQPMKPPRERVTDAETGEELVKVQPHWRKLKKGKKTQVADKPEPEPDERGVEVDGGNRIGTMTVGGPVDVSALAAASDISAKHAPDDQEKGALSEEVKGAAPSDALIQNEPPEMSDEEVAAIAEELEVAAADAESLQDSDESARHDVSDGGHHEHHDQITNEVSHSDLQQAEDEAHEPQSEEPVEQDYTEADQDEPPSEEREPQTDPSRLISVAAE